MSDPADTGPPTQPSPYARPEEEPVPAPAKPIVVPGQYHFLKRSTFALMLAAVWIPAAAVGVGLYYWWLHSLDKRWSAFAVLVFVVVCSVAAMLAAMADGKPLVAAAGIALMAAPLAAVAAAAVLHGIHYCDQVTSACLVGVLPY